MCPSPSRHGLSQTLHRCSSRSLLSTTRSASSPSPRLHPSLSGCAPLLPSLRRCSAPLPRYSPSRSTAAAVPFQIEHMVAEWSRGRRGGGGIEQRTARRQRNRAESTRRQRNRGSISLSIRQQGAALPLRRAWSAPTPKRRLSDD